MAPIIPYSVPKAFRRRGLAGTLAIGVLADLDSAGKAIGLEITAPGQVAVEQVNEALRQLGFEPIAPEELAPLRAA